mmetsp:Transcript_36069/g.52657  ORF Transcript_36069/g.52657 Transcript_36069/m.52657 type:complete len:129 (+) Transcript_36069:346-732(+)
MAKSLAVGRAEVLPGMFSLRRERRRWSSSRRALAAADRFLFFSESEEEEEDDDAWRRVDGGVDLEGGSEKRSACPSIIEERQRRRSIGDGSDIRCFRLVECRDGIELVILYFDSASFEQKIYICGASS